VLAVHLARSLVRVTRVSLAWLFWGQLHYPRRLHSRWVAIRTHPVIARTMPRRNRGRMRRGGRMQYGLHYRPSGMSSAEIVVASWCKSSASSYNGNCIEIPHRQDGRVAVRDTKDRAPDSALIFTRPEWHAFLKDARDGEFDYLSFQFGVQVAVALPYLARTSGSEQGASCRDPLTSDRFRGNLAAERGVQLRW
jgi:hypothetical protein